MGAWLWYKPCMHCGFTLPEGRVLPAHELYALTLENQPPEVMAVLAFAQKVHAGVDRSQKTSGELIPYITHPIMVCKLLQKIGRGADDSINLMIALLHDVLEDCEPYKSQPTIEARAKLLEDDLAHTLHTATEMDADNARALAKKIAGHCAELCNPSHMPQGKRQYQVDHSHKLTPRARLIKALDQCASAIEDILFESAQDPIKIRDFIHKGLDVTKSCMSFTDARSGIASSLYHSLFRYFTRIEQAADSVEATLLRQNFSIDAAIKSAREDLTRQMLAQADTLRADYEENLYQFSVLHPNAADRILQPIMGVTSVDMTLDEGTPYVSAYYLPVPIEPVAGMHLRRNSLTEERAAQKREEYEKALMMKDRLITQIEALPERSQVRIASTTLQAGRMVRRYEIEPPARLNDFTHAAKMTAQSCELMPETVLSRVMIGAANGAMMEQAVMISNRAGRK